MDYVINILNEIIPTITYGVSILTGWMVLRAAWLAYILFRDYKERTSRSFGFFFAGLAIGASRAMYLIPLTDPPLWNLLWQAISYFLIVLGLEMIYEEIRNDRE